MVGTNLDTLRYSGESDPRSLTLETTTAFVLHSRARHLLVHGSLCLPANIFSLFLPLLSLRLCIRSPLFHFTQNFTIYLSIFLFLLWLPFHMSVSSFLNHLTCAIPMWFFPSLSLTHLIYRAVHYDQQQFSSMQWWCARCCTQYIGVRSGHRLSMAKVGVGCNAEGDRVGSHARCIVCPRKEGRQA